MTRVVKHFSLHEIDGIEFRVISDVEVGVIPVIQVEEEVIREYLRHAHWPHRWVTLFVLHDLQPLVNQLQQTASMLPGKAEVLANHPVVNVYDLADPSNCQIFMNWAVMDKEGYLDDPLAIRGLLAHEHAHPLAEGETTRASRGIEIALTLEHHPTTVGDTQSNTGEHIDSRQWTADRQEAMHNLLLLLAQKQCLSAPRELFANELAIRSGFGEALLHLNRHNIVNASAGLRGREDLRQHFRERQIQGELTHSMASLLLLLGDLHSYADLPIEIAPFYRGGQAPAAQELESMLALELFPCLEPETLEVYTSLLRQYINLRTDLTPNALLDWCENVLSTLSSVLARNKVVLDFRVQLAAGAS